MDGDGVKPPEAADGRAEGSPAEGGAAPAGPMKEELYEQLLKLKAEFENYRKRIDRERPEWVRMGEAGLLARLLPLYDVLSRAHEQVLKLSDAGSGPAKELTQGLELIFKEFNKIWEAEGVRAIESAGKPYNHDLHEALGAVETDESPEGTVVEELERGYTFQGRVLRPARVRIAKPKGSKERGG